MKALLADVARRATTYIAAVPDRNGVPRPEDLTRLHALGGSFPEAPSAASEVIRLLDEIGSPATVASTGGRYFGFVTGGVLPAALAANWLAGAWDQNTALTVMSPVAATLEEIVLDWLREIFGLPVSCGAGFVTGATMANFTCLAPAGMPKSADYSARRNSKSSLVETSTCLCSRLSPCWDWAGHGSPSFRPTIKAACVLIYYPFWTIARLSVFRRAT